MAFKIFGQSKINKAKYRIFEGKFDRFQNYIVTAKSLDV